MLKNRLKEVREIAGISQAELAQKTGISRQTLSKIENNEEANLTTVTIAKIANAFDMKPSDLFLL